MVNHGEHVDPLVVEQLANALDGEGYGLIGGQGDQAAVLCVVHGLGNGRADLAERP